jgi:adenine specific DNA methylase Mod
MDELEESKNIYGDNFEKLWNSIVPEIREKLETLEYGKVLVFGTRGGLTEEELKLLNLEDGNSTNR